MSNDAIIKLIPKITNIEVSKILKKRSIDLLEDCPQTEMLWAVYSIKGKIVYDLKYTKDFLEKKRHLFLIDTIPVYTIEEVLNLLPMYFKYSNNNYKLHSTLNDEDNCYYCEYQNIRHKSDVLAYAYDKLRINALVYLLLTVHDKIALSK